MLSWLLATLILVSPPLAARGTLVQIEDKSNESGRIETWAQSSNLFGASILSVFTAADGTKIVMRIQHGLMQVTLPNSSLTVTDDGGDLVYVSRTINSTSAIQVFSRQEVSQNALNAVQSKRLSFTDLASSGLSTSDSNSLLSLQRFLDLEGPTAKMAMSGSCWFDLALSYAATFIAIAVCVGSVGLGCAGAAIGALAMWNAFARDCGPGAGYGLPREK